MLTKIVVQTALEDAMEDHLGYLRTSTELGGNTPFIVFQDADLDRQFALCVRGDIRGDKETGQSFDCPVSFAAH